jgi:hypothetical protein
VKRGAALAAVLLALSLANALVIGAAYVSRRQAAASRVDGVSAPLQPSAERALVLTIAGWDSVARSQQPIGSTVTPPALVIGVTVWVTRTSDDLYWLVAEARLGSPNAVSRRVGAVVRSVGGSPRVAFPRGWAELP